ncbi:MAG: hypothetical protein QOJ29_495, partial [Thermoleophilaceae bacterium]|nr:hypothetical protein [Thermoleophilaceae bacterium]
PGTYAVTLRVHPIALIVDNKAVIGLRTCPDVVIYGARGSGEDNIPSNVGMGPVPYQEATAILNRLPVNLRVLMIGVNYPAVSVAAFVGGSAAYRDSVAVGADVLANGSKGQAGLADLVQECPHISVVLIGLSQGAHVMHYTMSLAPAQPSAVTRRIAAILLFGDPVRQPQRSYNSDNQRAEGILLNMSPLPGATGPPNIVPYLEPATRSFCLAFDPICDYGGTALLLLNRQIHSSYGASQYIGAGANFAAERIVAAQAARSTARALAPRRRRHRCTSHRFGLYELIGCRRVRRGTRPLSGAKLQGRSRAKDKVSLHVGKRGRTLAVRIVDPCRHVFKGSALKITQGGVFDGATPGGFEIVGTFTEKRKATGTITDPLCRGVQIRPFAVKAH